MVNQTQYLQGQVGGTCQGNPLAGLQRRFAARRTVHADDEKDLDSKVRVTRSFVLSLFCGWTADKNLWTVSGKRVYQNQLEHLKVQAVGSSPLLL